MNTVFSGFPQDIQEFCLFYSPSTSSVLNPHALNIIFFSYINWSYQANGEPRPSNDREEFANIYQYINNPRAFEIIRNSFLYKRVFPWKQMSADVSNDVLKVRQFIKELQ